MKVLMLAWEFPPFIAGGLGMACYGLAKALLELGVEVDLVLPTREEVYFPLRAAEDVDNMPVDFLDPRRRSISSITMKGSLIERLKALGMAMMPETYQTTARIGTAPLEWKLTNYTYEELRKIHAIAGNLFGDEDLFKKVKDYTARILKYGPSLGCDIVHAHDWLTYPAGIVLKKQHNMKLVAHIHATEFDRSGGPGDQRIHNIEYGGLIDADSTIAVSKYTAQMIVDRYQAMPEKINIVHNAYSLLPGAVTEKIRLFKDPMILFLGRITIQKGPDYMLGVAKQVLRRFPRARFVMSGTGDMFSRILRDSAAEGMKDNFLFTGFLNREQVERVLAAADIFVLPSVSEPFGIAPLEAMAYGAVAIVSKQSGVSEVINNAYKVDFWDVNKISEIILRLLENPEELNKMALAGRKEVLAIGWKEAAEKTRRVYEETLCFT